MPAQSATSASSASNTSAAAAAAAATAKKETTTGVVFGIGAYGLWGLLPLYFVVLQPAGAVEPLNASAAAP